MRSYFYIYYQEIKSVIINDMILRKGQMAILAANIFTLLIFIPIFISRQNYEFLLYIGVIILLFFVILFTNSKVNYPNSVLWGLTVWAILHMSGGGVYIKGVKLYETMLAPIVGAPYNIFKYDQFVHMVGFGIAAFVMFYLIKPLLKERVEKWVALSIVIAMAGLGVGALNEIIEFIATVIMPKTGVGGYENTSLDLIANLIGAIIAVIIIRAKEKRTRSV